MKYKTSILLLLIVLVTGCDPNKPLIPVPPPPTISVERVGTFDATKSNYIMIITFKQLRANRGTGVIEDTPGLIVKTPAELAKYKEQVKFLLTQIEETEVVLKTQEPLPNNAVGGG